LSEVTLQTTGDNAFKNYLSVSSIKVDTAKKCGAVDEKGNYSSALNLY